MSGNFFRYKVWQELRGTKPTITPENAWIFADVEKTTEESSFSQPASEPFAYDLLEATHPHQDRTLGLLELLPGEHQAPICCNLTSYILDACYEYEALSYCWGDVTGILPITINDQGLSVTSNLRSALQHLRRTDAPRVLWVDAICINQDNLDERGVQVAMMGDIYRYATRTVVWLGPSDHDSHKAFRFLALLGQNPADSRVGDREQSVSTSTQMAINDRQVKNILADEQAVEKLRDSVAWLMERSYFTRIWVVQELALAREAQVVCGTDVLDWSTFVTGIVKGIADGDLGQICLAWFNHFDNALALARAPVDTAQQGGPAERLLYMLYSYRDRNATNPVDKVYSLLGLVGPDITALDLRPDYNLQYTEVYRATAVAILRCSSNLDIQGMCESDPSIELSSQRPSWVPNWWTMRSNTVPLTIIGKDKIHCDHATQATTNSLRFSADREVLLLSGHDVDSIAETSEHLHPMMNEDDWFDEDKMPKEREWEPSDLPSDASFIETVRSAFGKEIPAAYNNLSDLVKIPYKEFLRPVEILECFVRWEQFASFGHSPKKFQYPTGEDHRSIFWKTLCAGNRLTGGDMPTEAAFQEWRESLSATRTLLKLRANAVSSAYKPIALAGYVRKTWKAHSKFNEAINHAYNRRLARTAKGYLALVPKDAQAGDMIALCKGGAVPFCVRKDKDSTFVLVGEAYVHGIMKGEAFDRALCEAMTFR